METMKSRFFSYVSLVAVLCSTATTHAQMPVLPGNTSASDVFREVHATPATLSQLREGGYVLYIRHGFTDNTRPDQEDAIDVNNCDTQRVLSDAGRKLMKKIGAWMEAARIPVGPVITSPLCRTRESTELLFGKRPYQVNPKLMYWTRMSPADKEPRLEELKQLLSAPVPKKSNRVLVAHAPNMHDLIGLFVKPEGTVLVFSPHGKGGFEYLASIYPGAWEDLLAGD